MHYKLYSHGSVSRLITLIFLVIFSPSKTFSQELDRTQEVIEKIKMNGMIQSGSVLFIHYDKTIYLPRENIWFAGYLLEKNLESYQPDEITVVLVKDDRKGIVLEEKFAINNGFSSGNLVLPDTLSGGKYSLIAFSNRMRNHSPEDVFVQQILIKTSSNPELSLSLRLIEDNNNEEKHFELGVKDRKNNPVYDAKVNYWIGKNRFEGKTNIDGSFKIPLEKGKINPVDSILRVSVKFHESIQTTSGVFHLPIESLIVRFYPEGGNLVHATSTWVGWQTETINHEPISKTAYLYKDNTCIDTIQTDRSGLGRFRIIPMYGSDYYIRLLNTESNRSTFSLPRIVEKAPTISVAKAIANDTLRFRLTSKYPQKVIVFIHNYRDVFFWFKADLNAAGKNFAVNLDNIPKGLNTITVLDTTYKPWAERLFFAHFDSRSKLDIRTDKNNYSKREKIRMKLNIGENDSAVVSIACIQKSRLGFGLVNDIATYFYLTNELGKVPPISLNGTLTTSDYEQLENVLLIKGWRRYNWQEALKATPQDTFSKTSLLYISGTVTRQNRPLKKPLKVMVSSETTTTTIDTKLDGSFTLNNSSIMCDKKLRLMPLDNGNFKIFINDHYDSLARSIASSIMPPQLKTKNDGDNNDDNYVLKGIEHNILLKEVNIKSARSSAINNDISGGRPTNNCGDYVCKYGILNCANHYSDAGNHPPVKGKLYHVQKGNQIVDEIYAGCTGDENLPTQQIFLLKGVNSSKEFYGSDYSVLNPSEPEYLSTIFWKSEVLLTGGHPREVEFYTSDNIGPFKIIVQGVSKNSVVYLEKEVNVQ